MAMNYATDVSPCVFDLETAGLDNAADYLEPVQPAKNLVDPAKVKADIEKRTAERDEKLALDWNVGRIVALGWWTEQGGEQCRVCLNEREEAAVIAEFWRVSLHRTLVGFACKGFDLRYLIQRSRLLGLVHPSLDLGKYSHKGIEDLYLTLTFGDGTYEQGAMRRTLHAFCRRFDIPITDALSGKDIAGLVADGDWASVEQHCLSDVQLTLALARRLGVVQAQPEAAGVL